MPPHANESLTIALAGQFQRGKSLIFNLLIREVVSPMGTGERTTGEAIRRPLKSPYKGRANWTLVDMPGTNHDIADSACALDTCAQADLVLWVTMDKTPEAQDWEFMRDCYKRGTPVGIILNLNDYQDERQLPQLVKSIWAQAKSRFQLVPLSESGILVLRPQLADLSKVKGQNTQFPELFRKKNKKSLMDYDIPEAQSQSGIADFHAWFCPDPKVLSLRTEAIFHYLTLRKTVIQKQRALNELLSEAMSIF